jgi:hypothetical protein
MNTDPTAIVIPGDGQVLVQRPSRTRFVVALAVAGVSDLICFWAKLMPPVEWVLDGITALALFFILGRRWALLPGLIAEAIPGLDIFPFWILVVLSIYVYDDIRGRKKV